MIQRCPRCHQNFLYSEFGGGDVIHDCNSGNETLDNEDIKAIGNWEDYTGSGIISKTKIQEVPNDRGQFGASQIVDGKFIGEFTSRGNKKQFVRARKHEEYIDVSK